MFRHPSTILANSYILGMWLQPAFYHLRHFKQMKAVVLLFTPKAEAITAFADLITIHISYEGIIEGIERL